MKKKIIILIILVCAISKFYPQTKNNVLTDTLVVYVYGNGEYRSQLFLYSEKGTFYQSFRIGSLMMFDVTGLFFIDSNEITLQCTSPKCDYVADILNSKNYHVVESRSETQKQDTLLFSSHSEIILTPYSYKKFTLDTIVGNEQKKIRYFEIYKDSILINKYFIEDDSANYFKYELTTNLKNLVNKNGVIGTIDLSNSNINFDDKIFKKAILKKEQQKTDIKNSKKIKKSK